MRNQLTVVSVAAILTLSGCASTTEMSPRTRDTALGAGVGAGTGALIGAIAGGGKGAAIGAAAGAGLGAIAGNVWSRRMEEQKKEMEQDSPLPPPPAQHGPIVQRSAGENYPHRDQVNS